MHALKVVFVAAILLVVDAVSIDHDKVQPFAQREPVTLSEKLGVKYKPTMDDQEGCAVFPAVNAAGETNGGLKGSGDYWLSRSTSGSASVRPIDVV